MIHKIYIILRYSQLEEHFLGYVSEVNILGFGQVKWFLRGWFLKKETSGATSHLPSGVLKQRIIWILALSFES